MSGSVSVRQDVAWTELLDQALRRVDEAIRGGNKAAIDAAKAAYYELRVEVERLDQDTAATGDDKERV